MREITAKTRLCGIVGWPVEHSLSPPMQNAAMAALGLDWVYVAMPVRPENLAEAVAGLRATGFVGVNVTLPHKQNVIQYLDEIDDAARAMRAVNTIAIRDGIATGYNTDAYGFTQSVISEAEVMFEGATVLILGAGGVARAIAAGSAREGAKKVIVANRTRDRAEELVEQIGSVFEKTSWEIVQASEKSLAHAAARAEIVVNATSLGMRDADPLPIQAEALEPGQVVFDTIYAPPQTKLLKAAAERGAIAVGGLGMLARQGARALAIWSGLEPDEDLMLSTVRNLTAMKK